ncbi:MAG: DUF5329 family protein [Proteobacteria bacterium]|nr:DUF5329 family protein [Pseudomonadota bacterium]
MKNISMVLMVLLSLIVAHVYAEDFSETAKIHCLIASVETLEGANFIRNGNEYDTRDASDHLRLKLKVVGRNVKTAEDFIKLFASKSSITSEPYLMCFADGTTIKSEVFFANKLKTFATYKP